jgi:hypothetical protein
MTVICTFRVTRILAATEMLDTEKYEVELKGVEKRITDLELQFLTQPDGM